MEVELRLLGNTRIYLKKPSNKTSIRITIPNGTTAEQLMMEQFELPADRRIMAVIDGRQPEAGHVLRDGERIDVFYPLGGG
jgi:hypothetical protein